MLKYSTRRLFSTSTDATIKKIITQEMEGEGKEKILKKINIVQRITTMSSTKKKVLATYLTISGLCYTTATYNKGKVALERHRNAIKTNNLYAKKNTSEWEIVKDGCSTDSWLTFWDSIVFPWKFVTQSVPYVVLKLNVDNDGNPHTDKSSK